MIPVLYEATESTFNHKGIGELVDTISGHVVEERNGAFELELVYPVDGPLYGEIKRERLIKAKANDDANMEPQLFRIYSITRTMSQDGQLTVNVKAKHISYDLMYNPLKKVIVTDSNAQGMLDAILSNTLYPHSFTGLSDDETVASSTLEHVSAREALGGTEGSLLDNWRGEFTFDNFLIKFMQNRGEDNGVIVEYGKNLTDAEQDEAIDETVTAIYPYAKIQNDDQTETIIELPEKTIDSEYVNSFATKRCLYIDLSGDDVTDEDSLRSKARSYLTSNNIGKPKVSLTISFVQLWQTTEYQSVAPLEHVNLCDWVTVRFKKLGIDVKAKVIKTDYDILLEQYISVDLGDPKSDLADDLASVQQTANGAASDAQQAISNANTAIQHADGTWTFYGPDEPVGNIRKGSLWFKKVNGDYTEMYRYDGVSWVKQLSNDANDAKSSAQEALDQANAAVDKANQLSDDVGGAVDSATEAVNTANAANTAAQAAQDTAANAASDAAEAKDNAAAAMTEAQKKADADSVYTKTEIDEALDAYARVTTVDTLTGRVDSAETRITETENEIKVKADKSTVDTISGQVSTLSTEVSTQADQIAARITKADADAKYATQTSLKATSDGLLVNINQAQTDAQNYADSRVTQTANSLQSKITEAVNDVQVGGTNLIPNSTGDLGIDGWGRDINGATNIHVDDEGYNGHHGIGFTASANGEGIYTPWANISGGKQYTLSFFVRSNHTNTIANLLKFKDSDGNETNPIDNTVTVNTTPDNAWKKYVVTFTSPGNAISCAGTPRVVGGYYPADIVVSQIKLEEGNKATTWSPAPEDLATTSQISQLSDDINLRVKKNDVINQINVSTESILIAGKKIHITGDTTFDSGVVKAQNIDVANLEALSSNLGTVTAGNLKAVTITGSTITGSTIQTATSGPRIELSGNILQGYAANGSEYLRVDTTAGGALQLTRSSSATIANLWGGGALMLGNYDTNKWIGAGQPSNWGVGWSGDNNWLVFGYPGDLDVNLDTFAGLAINHDNSMRMSWGLAPHGVLQFIEADVGELFSVEAIAIGSGGQSTSKMPKIYTWGDNDLSIAHADVNIKSGKAIHLGNIGINSGHTIISEDGDHFNFTNAFSNGTPVAINASAFNKVSKWGFKENFAPMDPVEALTNILNTDVVRYNYKGNPELQVGLVIDDRQQPEYHAAADFVTADREAAKTDTIVGELMLAVKALHEKNQELESRIAQLEAA